MSNDPANAINLVAPDLASVIVRHDRALETRDSTLMGELLPEDFLQVTPAGLLKGREEWFDWFENITRYVVMNRRIVAVREFESTTAILSHCNPVMRVRDGEASEHQAMMLELWTKREGRWIKSYEQYTRPPQPNA